MAQKTLSSSFCRITSAYFKGGNVLKVLQKFTTEEGTFEVGSLYDGKYSSELIEKGCLAKEEKKSIEVADEAPKKKGRKPKSEV